MEGLLLNHLTSAAVSQHTTGTILDRRASGAKMIISYQVLLGIS